MKKWLTLAALLACALPMPVHANNSFSSTTIVAYTNEDRVQNGAGVLLEDKLLDKAAQAKADDMAKLGYFSHVEPDGAQPWHWFTAAGYYYQRAGENLAINFGDAQSLESAWMNSPAHRANLLKQSYTRVGIGIAKGTYQGKPATFVVQFFATPYHSSSLARL